METLFTVVSREDKYKTKNFVETFIYRFSDQLTVWGYAGLAALGLGLSGIAFVVAPVAAGSVGRDLAWQTPAPDGGAGPGREPGLTPLEPILSGPD